ncbi:MAG: DUF6033 family protein [Bacteroides sp.]|nr:DUF6033 family protein [Bacteroides sp.]
MIKNISDGISAYNRYNDIKNYKKSAEAAGRETEKETEKREESRRFDSFDRYPYRKNEAEGIGAEEREACTGKEKNMLGAFAEAARGYDLASGKTDDFGSYMIRSTKKSVIYIDPRFYDSIADDPEKIKEYSDAIESMKRIDKQMERKAKAQGKTIVSRGWYIDKDGGISSWSVVKTEKKVKKTQLEKMRDLQKKISEKRNAKRKADIKLAQKRSERKEELLRLEGRKKAAMKEKFKRKAKSCTVIDLNDLEIMRRSRQKLPNQKKTVTSIGSGYSI